MRWRSPSSSSFFVYYWTGEGGPTLLAMTLVPVIFVLFTLQALRDERPLSGLAAGRQLSDRVRLLRMLALLSPIT